MAGKHLHENEEMRLSLPNAKTCLLQVRFL